MGPLSDVIWSAQESTSFPSCPGPLSLQLRHPHDYLSRWWRSWALGTRLRKNHDRVNGLCITQACTKHPEWTFYFPAGKRQRDSAVCHTSAPGNKIGPENSLTSKKCRDREPNGCFSRVNCSIPGHLICISLKWIILFSHASFYKTFREM